MNEQPFTKGASYYDAIYREKNYTQETKQLGRLLQKMGVPSMRLLDIGCGTGTHAIAFAKLGYSVTGIDTSKKMLFVALKKISSSKQKVILKKANALTFRSKRLFGVAMSLFDVLSYQLTNKAIKSVFDSTYHNLENNGLFIFDLWYGPGVIKNPPTIQIKSGAGEDFTYKKKKTPTHNKLNHTVQVIHDTKISRSFREPIVYREVHTLRYFFYSEIKQFLRASGFSLERWGDPNNNFSPPKIGSWNAVFIAKKTIYSTKKGREK